MCFQNEQPYLIAPLSDIQMFYIKYLGSAVAQW